MNLKSQVNQSNSNHYKLHCLDLLNFSLKTDSNHTVNTLTSAKPSNVELQYIVDKVLFKIIIITLSNFVRLHIYHNVKSSQAEGRWTLLTYPMEKVNVDVALFKDVGLA